MKKYNQTEYIVYSTVQLYRTDRLAFLQNAFAKAQQDGYHFAVNADAPIIEVDFINKPDLNINPSGAKGLGEVGIIGAAAAIANAIYNATGKRMRDLPVTPDKVLMG